MRALYTRRNVSGIDKRKIKGEHMSNKAIITVSVPEPYRKRNYFGRIYLTADLDHDLINLHTCCIADREDVKAAALETIQPYINNSITNVITEPDIIGDRPATAEIMHPEAAQIISFEINETGRRAIAAIIGIMTAAGKIPPNHIIKVWAFGTETGLIQFAIDPATGEKIEDPFYKPECTNDEKPKRKRRKA